MALSSWVVATVVGLGLIQLVFFLMLRRRRNDPVLSGAGETIDDEVEGAGTRLCQECGAPNDATFRYCRECAGKLGGS